MSLQDVEIIRRSFVEWDENGEPSWWLLTEDAEAHDHDILDAGDYRGRAGLERWLADWSAAWSEFTMTPREFIDAGDKVVAVLDMRAKGRGSDAVVEREDAMVYTMREGMIARLDYFNNREQALEAAGLTA